MARRVRRRRLAQAFDRGERTLGEEADPERMDAFVARGLAVGGAAREQADATTKAGFAMPWPVSKQDYAKNDWAEVVSFAHGNGVFIDLTMRSTGPYLNMQTEDVENPELLIAVFWVLFGVTRAFVDEEVLEQLVVPRKWAPELAASMPVMAAPWCLDVERRYRGVFVPGQARDEFARTVSPYLGYWPQTRPPTRSDLLEAIGHGLQILFDGGSSLLSPHHDTRSEPKVARSVRIGSMSLSPTPEHYYKIKNKSAILNIFERSRPSGPIQKDSPQVRIFLHGSLKRRFFLT